MLAALSFNLLVIGRFFTAQTGAVNSRCCIEAVANAKNWLKGGANYTGVNPCIRTEQVSRMFEAQSSRKKLYYNVGRIGEAREFEIRQLGFVPSALVLPIRC